MLCINIIYGVGGGSWWCKVDGFKVFDLFEEFGVNKIDMVCIYGFSEEFFGRRGVIVRFFIDIKYFGGFGNNIFVIKDNILLVVKMSFYML